MFLLSIIIPIYNVEQYIEHCIKSILSQRADSDIVEIILVNDGTPDRSMEVANKLISKEKNVKIVNQDNQGLSAARNAGLSAANGEYVWFVDSDDWLLPHALSDIETVLMLTPNIDVIATILEMNVEGTVVPYQEYKPKVFALTGKEYLRNRYPQGASQRFILRRDFLQKNHLLFCRGILHEDGLFGYTMLYLAQKVTIPQAPVYAYRIRKSGSIMSSISMRTPTSMLFIHKQLVEFCNTKVDTDDKIWFRQEIFKVLINLFQFSKSLAFKKDFSTFYHKNRQYFNQEATRMIDEGFMTGKARIIRYCPLLLMRIKYLARFLLFRI